MSSGASVVTQICDAVVRELNATASFGQPLRAVRQNVPRFAREALANLQVVVAPRKRRNQILTRGNLKQLDFEVWVGVLKGIATNEESETDPLLLLCEKIGEHFPLFQVAIDTGQTLTCIAADQGDDETPFFDVEQLDALYQFTALIGLTFRGMR